MNIIMISVLILVTVAFVFWMKYELEHPMDADDEHDEAVNFRSDTNDNDDNDNNDDNDDEHAIELAKRAIIPCKGITLKTLTRVIELAEAYVKERKYEN